MRYAWDQFDAYFGPERVGAVASRWLYRPVLARLAHGMPATAGRVHRFVANSRHVARGSGDTIIAKRRSCIRLLTRSFISPPEHSAESHFLIVSAFVPYKRIDIAIEACRRIGAPLRIVGDGPDRERLQRLSGPDVDVPRAVADEQVRDVSTRGRVDHARRGRLRHRARRSSGLRPPGRRAGSRWRARNRDRRRDRRALRGADGGIARRRAATARGDCHSTPGRIRASAERFSRERHARAMHGVIDDTLAAPVGTRW